MNKKYRVLDLFCGAGGAAVGLKRVWRDAEIIGIDIKPQPRYPFQFVQADALHCPFNLATFDFIWASPPCQAYSSMQHLARAQNGTYRNHPKLIAPIRELLDQAGVPYVIENVVGASRVMKAQILICGYAVGLKKLARHRLFESNLILFGSGCQHYGKETIGVMGLHPDRRRLWNGRKRISYAAGSLQEAQEAMGIDWMEWLELKEAIPPAYSEFIARQIRSMNNLYHGGGLF